VAEPETPSPDNIKPVHIGGESFLDRLLPHIKKIMIAFAVVAVILTAVFTVRWVGQRGRAKETEKLAAVVAVASRPVRAAGEEATSGQPSFATGKERAAAVLDALAKQPTALASDSYRGALAFEAQQFDTAIASYRKASAQAGLDGALAREGLTLALEARATAEKDVSVKQKGLEEALTAARAIQPNADGPRRAYGLYHEARLLVLLGKAGEAKTLFEKVKTMADGTDLSALAEARLAALEAAS
jgi:tetratricopeptide (TPR) repeat protein